MFQNTREGETKLVSEKELAGWNEARRPIDELNKNIGEAKKKKPQTDELKQQIAAWQKEVKALEQKSTQAAGGHHSRRR